MNENNIIDDIINNEIKQNVQTIIDNNNNNSLSCDKYIKLQNNMIDNYFNEHNNKDDIENIKLINLENIGNTSYSCSHNTSSEFDFFNIKKNINDIKEASLMLSNKIDILNKKILEEKTNIIDSKKNIEELKKKSIKTFKHLLTIEQNIQNLKQIDSEPNNMKLLEEELSIQRHHYINHYINDIHTKLKSYHKSMNTIKYINSLYSINQSNSKVCSICLTNEISTFTIPCGHTFCSECSEKLNNKCYICRQLITKVCNMYY